MRRVLFLFSFCLSLSHNCFAQDGPDEEGPVTKIGGMYYGRDPSAAYSLCLERERLFPKKAFSRGPRVDYDVTKSSPQTYGSMSLVLGYQFKYYPFYAVRGRPTAGFFLGVNPCYSVKVRDQFPYGPGVGFLMGYQIWIMNTVALSLEWDLSNIRNINQTAGLPNTSYWNFFSFVKAGYWFRKK
jgi:hypothetical protein